MSSEESYNPYHSLHEAPERRGSPQDVTPRAASTQPTTGTRSFPVTQKRRALILLIIPVILLLVVAGLFCFMLLWLLYHRRRIDPDSSESSASVSANNDFIVDEAAQWCLLLKGIINNHPDCDSSQESGLLGLALSGLLVSHDPTQLLSDAKVNK